ncbi:MAG: class I SAM-dependent methyltransferase [Candidatus Promineifilaceae bacterium]
MSSADYYRALPQVDLSGRHERIWQIRTKGYDLLLARVVSPMAENRERPLKVLDVEAGNCWLSNQFARRGHDLVAVDLITNEYNGLGAYAQYDVSFTVIRAEFDRLPVDGEQADLVIYNGALHYSTSFQGTLGEGLRALRPGGQIVVMDSPIYRNPESGAEMVRERQARFAEQCQFQVQSIASENFLTFDEFDRLSTALGMKWNHLKPDYGFL